MSNLTGFTEQQETLLGEKCCLYMKCWFILDHNASV